MYRAVRRGSIHYRKFPRAADDTVQRVRIAGAVDELHSLALFLKMGRDAPQQGRFAAAVFPDNAGTILIINFHINVF